MSKRIKILYTIPNFDTAGSGKVVYDLVKHIDKKCFEPHICCMHNRGDYFKTVQSLGVPIHIFQFATPYRPFFSFLYRVLKIARFFKKQQFDLIHSWHWSSDISEPLAAKLTSIPFVYTKKAMGWGNKSWKWRSQLSAKIITINSDMKTQFFSSMSHKITNIPIGLNTNYFEFVEKKFTKLHNIKLIPSDFVIVSIANLVPVKGIEILLEAVLQLNKSEIKVIVVGDDNSNYARDLKLKYKSKSIFFTGKEQNIKDYLSIADLFVIPTKDEGRKEGQPIAPIEAMLSGRIVLGSNISGIKDLLSQFENCLFEAGNIEDLKSKIVYILNLSLKDRRYLASQMRLVAERNYNINRSIELHEFLYKKILNIDHAI